MKALILAVLATSLFFSANSQAKLTVMVDVSPDGSKTYVDLDEIQKVGNLAYYTQITSYVEPQPNEMWSYAQYIKINCDTLQSAMLTLSGYKLPKAQGETMVVIPYSDPEWEDADYDGPIGTNLRSKVCNS